MELSTGGLLFPREYAKILGLCNSSCDITEICTTISREGKLLDLTFLLVIASDYLARRLNGAQRCYKIFKALDKIFPGKIETSVLKSRAHPGFVEKLTEWEEKNKVVDGKVGHKVVIGDTVVTFTLVSQELTFVSLRNKIAQLLRAIDIHKSIKKIVVKSTSEEKLLDDFVVDMRRRRTIIVTV